MSSSELKQRLAAILAADVAGYSRLMATDERATVAALDAARAVFRTQIESNRGRVIDMAGDSVLAVFETATGAVSAALTVQQQLTALLANVPEDRRMRFRIGLHMGDVMEKGDGTIYGDGVNIAARLEGLAEPGGITVSDSVRNAVKGKIGASFEDQGEQTVKNIAEPVRTYRLSLESAAAASNTSVARLPSPVPRPHGKRWLVSALSLVLMLSVAALGWLWSRRDASSTAPVGKADLALADSQSIAVLPFTNMSEDKGTAYFADGVHEDLLTQLALLVNLKVVSRTSVMEYRDTKKNARQIAAELGVGSLVEGSVRRAGNHVRVTAQLIDASSDKHVWAKSYDRELKDIFAIQSELATEIAKALKITLAPQERTRLARKPTDNLEAYDLFLRAQELFNRSQGTIRLVASSKDRIALLAKAVQLDSNFAFAWARLAAEHGLAYYSAVDMTPARQAQAKAAMDRALSLAPEDLHVIIEEGNYYTMALADHQRAAQAFEKVLRVAPHNVDALNGLASAYFHQGRIAERVALLERALAVEPRNFGALRRLKNHYLAYRRYDRALAYQQELIDIRPDDVSLQADYSRIEYYRTGTWTAYDKWRSKLPDGAERKYFIVHASDLERAITQRDYAEVLRLADVESEDERGTTDASQSGIRKSSLRALTHRAKGDRVQTIEHARAGLRLLDAEIRNRPKDWVSWFLKAWIHAILGERGLAVATHARAVTVAKEEEGTSGEDRAQRTSLGLNALLGNRKEALAEASRQLRLPDSYVHEFRASIELAALWDDPQFQAILNDPANNAPLNISNRYSKTPQK